MGTSKLLWVQPDKMLGVTCDGLVSHPGGVEILQEPGMSVGTDEPSGSPNYDWGRLYLTLLSGVKGLKV